MLAANFIHLLLVCLLIKNSVSKFLFIMSFMLLSCLDHLKKKKKKNTRNEWIKNKSKTIYIKMHDLWSSWSQNQHQPKYRKRNLGSCGKWTGQPLKTARTYRKLYWLENGKAQQLHTVCFSFPKNLQCYFHYTFSEFGDLLVGGTGHGFSSKPGKAIFFPAEDEGHYRPTGSALHCHT